MGPLFAMALMAIAAGSAACIVAVAFRLFVPTRVAVRCAVGFVTGAGCGAALYVGLFALTMGVGAKLTGLQPLAYLAALAVCAALGGAVVSWQVARACIAR